MGNALRLSPFPPLTWDGLFWRASLTVPWYPSAETAELIVRPDYSRSAEPVGADEAPRPTGAQAAAFAAFTDPDPPLRPALLAQFQRFVPELAAADWDAVRAFFGLATVLVFHPATDDVSYTGLVFNCLRWDAGYEHGVGVVAHKERVVYFGMAEEARDETQVLKEIRRLARRGKRS